MLLDLQSLMLWPTIFGTLSNQPTNKSRKKIKWINMLFRMRWLPQTLMNKNLKLMPLFKWCKGTTKNYVDQFLPHFDHLPTKYWHLKYILPLLNIDIVLKKWSPKTFFFRDNKKIFFLWSLQIFLNMTFWK